MRGCLCHFVATVVFASCSLQAQTRVRVAPAQDTDGLVTSVTGESWLNHLHRSLNETSMGRTYHLGPGPPEPGEEPSNWKLRLSIGSTTPTVILRGSDLYRLNCQGCHRESGLGAPPEINSIIDPVRATSATLVVQRTKNSGMNMSRTGAAQLAKQSEQALLRQVRTGSQDMPAFAHLNAAEILSLVAYLKELAGVPGAEANQRIIRESPLRVGELIAKSTCHICHDTAGLNPDLEQLQNGAIPSLGTLTARTNLAGFVRKVTVGAPLFMGDPPMISRGRMPVFDYLSQNEAADVYLYLTLYPPSDTGTDNLGRASPRPTHAVVGAVPTSSNAVNVLLPNESGVVGPSQTDDWMLSLLMLGVVGVTVIVIAGVGALTLREFRRISPQSRHAREDVKRTEREELHHRAA